jgi:hypothetical protein
MAGPDADSIRLTVPADAAMHPVVEVAIGTLARRLGLSDGQVASARAEVGAAFDAAVAEDDGGGERDREPVRLEIRAGDHHLEATVARGSSSRTVRAPRG